MVAYTAPVSQSYKHSLPNQHDSLIYCTRRSQRYFLPSRKVIHNSVVPPLVVQWYMLDPNKKSRSEDKIMIMMTGLVTRPKPRGRYVVVMVTVFGYRES